MAMTAAELSVKIGADSSELESKLQQSSASVNSFASGIGKVAAVAATAFAAVGAAAVGGLGYAVSSASDFQAVISQVGAVSGATAPQLGALSDLALQMGADTAYSASEAAQAMAELAKGGISVEQMASTLPGTLDLAAAGGLGLAEAATIATDAMSIFASQGVTMEQVANAYAGAANISSISVQDMASAMAYAGPAAVALGFSLEDTSAAIALLGANGIKGSAAGTGLRTVLTSLAAPTDKAAGLIKDLGLQFFDSSGHMKDMAGISDELKSKLAGMSDQQRIATLETLAGKEGMSTLIALMGEGDNSIQSYTEKLKNAASAHETGKKMMDNFAGSVDALKGSVETAAITLGLALLPMLRQVVDGATAGVNAAVPFIKAWGPQLAAGIQAGLGQAVAIVQSFGTAVMATFRALGSGDFNSAFGPILNAIQTAFGPSATAAVALFVSNVLSGLQTARDAVITAKQAFSGEWVSSDTIAGPVRVIGEAFTVLGDVVRALQNPMATLQGWLGQLSTQFPTLAPIIGAVADAFTKWGPQIGIVAAAFVGLGPAMSVVGAILPTVVGAFTGLGPIISVLTSTLPLLGSVIAALGFPITAVIVAVGLLAAAWATNFMGIQTATMPILTAIGAYITGTFLPALTQMGTFLMTTVVPAFVAGWAAIQAGVSTALAAIMPYVQQFIGFLTGQLLPGIQGIIAVAVPAFQSMGAAVIGAFQAALPGVQAFIAGIVALGAAVLPIIGQVAGIIIGSLGPAVMAIVGWAQTVIPQFAEAFVNVAGIVGPIVGGIAEFIGSTLTAIAGFITSHRDTIVTIFQGAWDAISGLIGIAWALISGIISTGLQVLSGDWTGAWNTIKATAQTVWDGIQQVISGAWTAITGVITLALEGAKTLAANAWTAIETAATTGWNAVKTAVSTALDGMKTAVTTGIGTIETEMKGLPGKALAALGNLGTTLFNAGASLLDGLIGGIRSKLGELQSALSGITGLIPDWKGPAAKDAKLLFDNGQLIMQGLMDGIADKQGALRDQLTGVTGDIAGTVGEGLDALGGTGGRVAALATDMAQGATAAGLVRDQAGLVVDTLSAVLRLFDLLTPLKDIPRLVVAAIFDAMGGALEQLDGLVHRADAFLVGALDFKGKMLAAAAALAVGQAVSLSSGGSVPNLPAPNASIFSDTAALFKQPDIPKLALGGIATRPTLAVVGDAGPEAIVPLNQYNRGGGGGGGGTMYVTVEYHDHTMQGTDRARLADFARSLKPELEKVITGSW